MTEEKTIKFKERIDAAYDSDTDLCREDKYLQYILAYKRGFRDAENMLTKK